MFCGKPLIYWNLLSLQNSSVDKIIVATDSNQIKNIVISFSLIFKGCISMQSTGQKGMQTWHPVQLSSSTTATDFGLFFLKPTLVAGSPTDL